MAKVKVKVDWDTEIDGRILTLEEAGLPEIVEVPDDVVAEDMTNDNGEIADWLSDNYGWCVNGCFILDE